MEAYTVERGMVAGRRCPVCGGFSPLPGQGYRVRSESGRQYRYYTCRSCGSIYLEPAVLADMDAGQPLTEYSAAYWDMEYDAAVKRCGGEALARLAEAVYYCRIPIRNMLDIGTGTGRLLDAVERYLPGLAAHFYGVERFPPLRPEDCTRSPNYLVGDYSLLEGRRFECGLCIEVVEHLTPRMLTEMFAQIARVSAPGALYLLNSGFAPYVEQEEPRYLDPFCRGHVVSYSAAGLRALLGPLGFTVRPIRGKNWLIAIEYESDAPQGEDITDRVWRPLPENMALLTDPVMGSVMQILGRESVRAYLA